MAITVEAVYENGVFKPSEPLPWKDGDKVRIAISSLESPILKAYGIMGWKGTSDELDRLLSEIELDEVERCGPSGTGWLAGVVGGPNHRHGGRKVDPRRVGGGLFPAR